MGVVQGPRVWERWGRKLGQRGGGVFFGFGGFFGHTAPLVGSLFPDQGLKPHPQQ